MIVEQRDEHVAIIGLNDPAKRNALSIAMFDALEAALDRIRADDSIRALLIRGEGPAFCAGFDLQAVVEQPSLMAEFIHRLSRLIRGLRRLPVPVVASVHGAAIAGGCAILSACDFVIIARDARVGYPVHRIGVSPAVTLPTLLQAVAPGAARALVMSGDLIDGAESQRIGLASHLAPEAASAHRDALALAQLLASRPPHAMRITKHWLNEIDGSLDDSRFDDVANGSASPTWSAEAISRLREVWRTR